MMPGGREAKRRFPIPLSLLMLYLTAGALEAQQVETPAADPADVGNVDAIVAAVYDVISGAAGEDRNWDRMRSLFLPGARLIPSWLTEGGEVQHRYMSVDEWIEQAARYFAETPFFEMEIHRVEENYGRIAHAFSTYESRHEAGGYPFTRGINSIQLLADGQRWWIVNIFWQGETEAEPLPAAYLP